MLPQVFEHKFTPLIPTGEAFAGGLPVAAGAGGGAISASDPNSPTARELVSRKGGYEQSWEYWEDTSAEGPSGRGAKVAPMSREEMESREELPAKARPGGGSTLACLLLERLGAVFLCSVLE